MLTPIAEEGWDGWLWHSYFSVAGPLGSDAAHVRLEIDSKAMRKFDSFDTIFGATEVVESGTEVMSLIAQTRMLFKI